MLKKEFKEEDIQRVRNIVKGKSGDSTKTIIGFKKDYKNTYKEGDVWMEEGKKWTIKNNVKQSISKLKLAKSNYQIPLFCPNCERIMKKRFDKDYYKVHKKCYDCVIDFEAELRRSGLWNEYEKRLNNADIDFFIKDFKDWAHDVLSESTDIYFAENGDQYKFRGGFNKEKVLSSIDKTVEYLENLKK